MLWCAVAGLAQLGLVAFGGRAIGAVAEPPSGSALPTELLAALGYPFVLPAVALLHARAEPHRRSGAVLATSAAAAAMIVGIGASADVALRPAALVLLGMWWWTLGKMGAETPILPRRFGLLTAALGALVLAAAALAALGVRLAPGTGDLALFDLAHVALGAWLLTLAAIFARR